MCIRDSPRIRGAIIDELRAIDWVPRSVRAKARSVEQAYASLEATLLRTPTDAEVAAELDISEQDLQDILRQISFVGVAALDEVFLVGGDRSERTTLGDTIPDAAAGPVAMFEDKESKEILSQAIMQLGDRERTVLSLYYYEGLTLAEIGEILGVTESRVCQIHTKAVLQLRARLSDRTTPDGSVSYTHLDVYKRQALVLANDGLRVMPSSPVRKCSRLPAMACLLYTSRCV